MMPITLVKCSCGHPSCDYYGTSDGSFAQGTGYDKETAMLHLKAVNSYPIILRNLYEMIDGGEECRGRDTQITKLIDIMEMRSPYNQMFGRAKRIQTNNQPLDIKE